MAGTSTALQALLQGQRADRIQAFRSLGAQRIVQLESELAEARMTLFGPLPAAAAAPPVDTAPSRTSAPPAKQQAQPPPPAQPAPPPAKTPPPREATPPRSATPTPRPHRDATPPRRDQTPPRLSSATQRQQRAQHRTHRPGRAKEKAKQSGSTCKAPPGARTASLIHHGVAPHHGPTQHRTARQCGATHRHRHRTPSLAPHRAASRCPRLCAPRCVG